MSKINRPKKTRLAIPMVVLVMFLLFSYPQKTQAAIWPGIDPNIKRMLDTVYDTVKGIILGAAKQAAVKMLNEQIDNMMGGGGGSGSAAFITDWSDYLVTQPKDEARVYMNDTLSQMLGGRGSSTLYSSEGFSGVGGYSSTLRQLAKNAMQEDIPRMTYEGDPSQMFEDGNFKNMSHYLSGVNNPWAFEASVQDQFQRKLAERRLMNQTRSIAYQGFNGTTSGNGNITYPGILTKEMVANVENIPNNTIATARNIPEVITAVASKMITKLIQQGFSSAQDSAQNESSTESKLDSGINNSVSENGPGTLYSDSGSGSSAWVNPDLKN